MEACRRRKQEIVSDILVHYHYYRWCEDFNASISCIPENLATIYYRFGQIVITPIFSVKSGHSQIKELKKIRKNLKKIYEKGVYKK